jgi:hypothetical protein
MHEGTTIRVYELQGSFVELILVNFDPISLHDFFEHFPFQDVLRLEPIVSLFQSVYTTTFDHTASEDKGLADSTQHLHSCLRILLCETS